MSDSETLSIILNRMNHQDRTLDEIKNQQAELRNQMGTHMRMEEEVRPAIHELIAILNGSKVLSRVILWLASLAGAVWAFVMWAKDHVKM